MKIILLQDVKKLGKKSEIKNVSDGYARNFLIPNNFASPATDSFVGKIEKQKEAAINIEQNIKDAAKTAAEKINDREFHFYPQIGEKGEVFGAITKNDVKEAVEKSLFFIPKELRRELIKRLKINLTRSIKTTGIHPVEVDFGDGIKSKISVVVNKNSV